MKNQVKQAVVMKIVLYCAPLFVILIPVLLIIALTMNNPSVVCQTDTTTTTTSSDSDSSNGSLTDKNSDIGKRSSYIANRFKQAGYSGDNISAIIAIGWRESNLNPKVLALLKVFGNGVLVVSTVIVIKIRQIQLKPRSM